MTRRGKTQVGHSDVLVKTIDRVRDASSYDLASKSFRVKRETSFYFRVSELSLFAPFEMTGDSEIQ